MHQLYGGSAQFAKRYALLNSVRVRESVAAKRPSGSGYPEDRIEMRLYVGTFANGHEERARARMVF